MELSRVESNQRWPSSRVRDDRQCISLHFYTYLHYIYCALHFTFTLTFACSGDAVNQCVSSQLNASGRFVCFACDFLVFVRSELFN